ncbi:MULTISPECIES: NAD(P)H-binding protein [unclassified Streptomyces]|uniref:NAD(P)H-binding protein n=1 Tax=unclassified Streptomyces TaxID=2593676 RepID=UPI002259DD63|nr:MULTISPECIES: NAD(P)H-binding protein [unclassified Streptomyces]MCX5060307.1 NAD(P)H-binding protein [Streptomyces sp. NBC_00452]MCX5286401.1 NAD(P)H-binding protein [Streptomyces sp. NBC_00183]
MILVTGATGHVGGELVRRLVAAGEPVRAMTRRPAEARLPKGVEAVYGDADDPASLDAAFACTEGAFLMSAQGVGTAPGPTHDLALAEAAARAGLRRLVKLSVLDGGAGADVIARWHAQAEAAVTDPSPGFAWTLLRPGRFMSNALQWAGQLRAGDEVSTPFADRPAASIDPADLAEVAALALTTDDHAGATYELSGPQSLTPADELAILGEALGRDLRLRPVPDDAARTGMAHYGFPPEVVDAIMQRTLESDRGAEVLPTVEKALGRRPRTFAQWAREHAGAFAD